MNMHNLQVIIIWAFTFWDKANRLDLGLAHQKIKSVSYNHFVSKVSNKLLTQVKKKQTSQTKNRNWNHSFTSFMDHKNGLHLYYFIRFFTLIKSRNLKKKIKNSGNFRIMYKRLITIYNNSYFSFKRNWTCLLKKS